MNFGLLKVIIKQSNHRCNGGVESSQPSIRLVTGQDKWVLVSTGKEGRERAQAAWIGGHARQWRLLLIWLNQTGFWSLAVAGCFNFLSRVGDYKIKGYILKHCICENHKIPPSKSWCGRRNIILGLCSYFLLMQMLITTFYNCFPEGYWQSVMIVLQIFDRHSNVASNCCLLE